MFLSQTQLLIISGSCATQWNILFFFTIHPKKSTNSPMAKIWAADNNSKKW